MHIGQRLLLPLSQYSIIRALVNGFYYTEVDMFLNESLPSLINGSVTLIQRKLFYLMSDQHELSMLWPHQLLCLSSFTEEELSQYYLPNFFEVVQKF